MSYSRAHAAVKRRWGSARGYACQGCDRIADAWAYDHRDPHEGSEVRLVYSTPRAVPFSREVEHYLALCRRCHNRLDLGGVLPDPIRPRRALWRRTPD